VRPHRPTRIDAELLRRHGHDPTSVVQLRTYSAPPSPGSGHRGRRALAGVLAISAVTVAGSLAFTSVRSEAQQVTIVPAARPAQPLMVFVANYGDGNVVGYPFGGSDGSPRVTLSTDVSNPQGLRFDSAGDLWVASASGLAEYALDQLTKRSATPKTLIEGGASFAGLAFDSSGNLWVDDYGADDVDEYAKSQLTGTYAPSPKVTLTDNNEPSVRPQL
jgi:hypothetical protein